MNGVTNDERKMLLDDLNHALDGEVCDTEILTSAIQAAATSQIADLFTCF